MKLGFCFFFAFLFSLPAFAKPKVVPGQYLVMLKAPKPEISHSQLEQMLRAKVIDQVRSNVYLIEKGPRLSPSSVLRSLREQPLIAYAEPNVMVHAVKTPNDPEFPQLWGFSNKATLDKDSMRGLAGVDIQAERAWDVTTGARNIVVAVIDTGIDFSHPDLTDNAWVNEIEAKGQPGVDDDFNGYVDDINGFNFVAQNGDVKDDYGHGSHCAGIIGARGDNGVGIAGVSWNVRLMAIKFLDRNGSGTIANAIKAIDYARVMRAHISNNSWGGAGASDILRKTVEDTMTAGQLFVAAAGNDGTDNDQVPTQPAGFNFPNVLAVAAVDNRGNLADFSNYGDKSVQIAAPGVNVFSTVPGGYEIFSGTSMAAPHAAGVAALVWSKFPKMTYAQVRQRLIDSARPFTSLKGKTVSAGFLDAYYAVTGLTPPTTDPNDPSLWTNRQSFTISTPHPYPDQFDEVYTVKLPGASRIAVHFSKFQTEASYDLVRFFNANNETLGTMSGSRDGSYSPIADGDTLIIKIVSDGSNSDHGFDVDEVVFEATSLPDPAPTPTPVPVPDPSPTPAPTPVI
jgi:thermitase